MTTLGKILVLVNLVFSLVTGALIILVFATRTNWHNEYNKRVAELNTTQQTAQAYRDEAEAVRKKAFEEADAAKKVIDDRTKERDDLTAELKTKTEEYKTLVGQEKEAGANATAALEEKKRLADEVQKLKDEVSRRDKQVFEALKQAAEMTEKAVMADLAYKSQVERSKQLLEQVAELNAEVRKLQARTGTTTTIGQPVTTVVAKPPPDARGVITKTDPKNNLVTISIGSDAGISRGHILAVYRLKPTAEYLGEVEIVDADHHASVGRLTNREKAQRVQAGDQVASNILGGR